MLGDDREERLGVADPGDHRVPGVLEEAGKTLAEYDRVLGDHDPHGIATSTRVPLPRGLTISTSLHAQRRGLASRRGRSRADDGAAHSVVGDGHVQRAVVLHRSNRHLRRRPVLDGVRERLHATKYAAASTLAGARSPLASTSTGTGEVLARSRRAAARPSSSRAGRTPAAIWRRSAIASPTSATIRSSAGERIRAARAAGSAGAA